VWLIYLERPFLRCISFLFILLGLALIWSETVFPFGKRNLSIPALLFASIGVKNFTVMWLSVFCTVGVITAISFWGIFKFRFFNFYRLVGNHQSDAYSLLFNALFQCRLIAPLAYNFLLMIGLEQAAFSKVMGSLVLTPVFGEQWNLYFPISIAIFCAITYFNVYTSCISWLSCKKYKTFEYDEDYEDSKEERGRELVSKAIDELKKRKRADMGSDIELELENGADKPLSPAERLKRKYKMVQLEDQADSKQASKPSNVHLEMTEKTNTNYDHPKGPEAKSHNTTNYKIEEVKSSKLEAPPKHEPKLQPASSLHPKSSIPPFDPPAPSLTRPPPVSTSAPRSASQIQSEYRNTNPGGNMSKFEELQAKYNQKEKDIQNKKLEKFPNQ